MTSPLKETTPCHWGLDGFEKCTEECSGQCTELQRMTLELSNQPQVESSLQFNLPFDFSFPGADLQPNPVTEQKKASPHEEARDKAFLLAQQGMFTCTMLRELCKSAKTYERIRNNITGENFWMKSCQLPDDDTRSLAVIFCTQISHQIRGKHETIRDQNDSDNIRFELDLFWIRHHGERASRHTPRPKNHYKLFKIDSVPGLVAITNSPPKFPNLAEAREILAGRKGR